MDEEAPPRPAPWDIEVPARGDFATDEYYKKHPEVDAEAADPAADNPDEETPEALTAAEVMEMTCAKLRAALAERGLDTTGNKEPLQTRLLEAIGATDDDTAN